MSKPIIQPFGDCAILLSWDNEIRPEINRMVRNADGIIQSAFKDEIIETVITYNSLAVYLKLEVNVDNILNLINILDLNKCKEQEIESYLWEIPVCYSENYGLDLNDFSGKIGLSINDIVERHSSTIYSVYFIGFLPGFLYLGGLPLELHHPRKKIPRLTVPEGAIGIGGEQTGIYPMESPGGWNIIGQSPVKLFNSRNDPPIDIQPGDKIQFVAIDEAMHHQIISEIAADQYSFIKRKLT